MIRLRKLSVSCLLAVSLSLGVVATDVFIVPDEYVLYKPYDDLVATEFLLAVSVGNASDQQVEEVHVLAREARSQASLGSVILPRLAPHSSEIVQIPLEFDPVDIFNGELVITVQSSQDDVAPDNNVARIDEFTLSLVGGPQQAPFSLVVDAYEFENWGGFTSEEIDEQLAIIAAEASASNCQFPTPIIGILRALFGPILTELAGHCYGMASTVCLYRDDPALIPGPFGSTVYGLSNSDPSVLDSIIRRHREQFLNPFSVLVWRLGGQTPLEFRDAMASYIDEDRPAMVLLKAETLVHGEVKELGHAINVYAYTAVGNEWTFYCYDNEHRENANYVIRFSANGQVRYGQIFVSNREAMSQGHSVTIPEEMIVDEFDSLLSYGATFPFAVQDICSALAQLESIAADVLGEALDLMGFGSSTALVIDVSGSMDEGDPSGPSKIEAATDAAIAFVNMLRSESSMGVTHRVAVVAFSDSASVIQPMTADLDEATRAIRHLAALGDTNMYDGLDLANDQLINGIGSEAIVLLSDGMPTIDPTGETDDKQLRQNVLLGPVADAATAGNCIYVIGVGDPNATNERAARDAEFLDDIAQATGCSTSHHSALEAADIFTSFIEMRQVSMGREIVERASGWIKMAEDVAIALFPVEAELAKLVMSLSWYGSELELRVEDPDGILVTEQYPGATISVYENLVYAIVENPKAGVWSASAYGVDVPPSGERFSFLASVEEASEPPQPVETEPTYGLMKIEALGDIELALKDPKGRILSSERSEIPDAILESSGNETTIRIPERIGGDYELRVTVREGADRLDRFDVSATDGFDTVELADRKFIIHAPREPYVIRSTADGFFDATGLPESVAPEPVEAPTSDARGGARLLVLWIALGGVVIILGIGALLRYLRSRYYI